MPVCNWSLIGSWKILICTVVAAAEIVLRDSVFGLLCDLCNSEALIKSSFDYIVYFDKKKRRHRLERCLSLAVAETYALTLDSKDDCSICFSCVCLFFLSLNLKTSSLTENEHVKTHRHSHRSVEAGGTCV